MRMTQNRGVNYRAKRWLFRKKKKKKRKRGKIEKGKERKRDKKKEEPCVYSRKFASLLCFCFVLFFYSFCFGIHDKGGKAGKGAFFFFQWTGMIFF